MDHFFWLVIVAILAGIWIVLVTWVNVSPYIQRRFHVARKLEYLNANAFREQIDTIKKYVSEDINLEQQQVMALVLIAEALNEIRSALNSGYRA